MARIGIGILLTKSEWSELVFPCEECDDIFEEYDNVREHFLKEHKRYERIGCIEKSCKITFKDLLGLKSLCLFFNFKGTLFYKTFSSESI